MEEKFPNLPRLLSIPEVCEYLQMGETTVREMIRKGELRHIRIRNRIRVSEDEILAYLQRNTVETKSLKGWKEVTSWLVEQNSIPS